MIEKIISKGNLVKFLDLFYGYRETDTYAILDGSCFNPKDKKIISIGKQQEQLPDLILPQGTQICQDDIVRISTEITEKTGLCMSQYSLNYREQIKIFEWVDYFDLTDSFQYIRNMKTFKYCLSPHGSKPDCFRHWEAMYMGCIPITLKSPWLEGFYDMPILFLDSWDELTPELLEDKYDELNNRSREKLDINYWLNKVKEITNE